MTDVSLGLALLGGLISFFSPCVLPVIPAYFSVLVGGSLAAQPSRRALVGRSLLFAAGLSLVFVVLGISASALGRLIGQHRLLAARVGGIVVILLGLQMLGVLRLPQLLRERRLQVKGSGGAWQAFLLGVAFAAGWTPCIGPVLSGILFLAGSAGRPAWAALLLLVYSLGLAVPFLLCSLLADKAVAWIRRHGRLTRYAQWLGGLILVLMGAVLFFGQLGRLSSLLPAVNLPL